MVTKGPGGRQFTVGCKLFFQFIGFILVGPLIFCFGPYFQMLGAQVATALLELVCNAVPEFRSMFHPLLIPESRSMFYLPLFLGIFRLWYLFFYHPPLRLLISPFLLLLLPSGLSFPLFLLFSFSFLQNAVHSLLLEVH